MTLLRNAFFPDPDTDNGKHRFKFSFIPGRGKLEIADTCRAAISFNRPPVVIDGKAKKSKELFSLPEKTAIIPTSTRFCSNKSLEIRFFNTAGKNVKTVIVFGKTPASIQVVDFLHNKPGKHLKPAGRVSLSFRKYEIKTLLINL